MEPVDPFPGRGRTYELGPAVTRPADIKIYERGSDDPVSRPLKILALDPHSVRLEDAAAIVRVPYEPLEAGPIGHLFAIDGREPGEGSSYRPLSLDDPRMLMRHGRDPSPTDRFFHDQMVYAVSSLVYARFSSALGRHTTWGFPRRGDGDPRLWVHSHAFQGDYAYYDRQSGELQFGFYRDEAVDRALSRGTIYTSASHDVVAHELTHALADSVRPLLSTPSCADVLAFHEGFADLVAIFQRLTYEETGRIVIAKAAGRQSRDGLLTAIVSQLTNAAISPAWDGPTRIDLRQTTGEPVWYAPGADFRLNTSVLVSAVLEAFVTIFKRKARPLVRLVANRAGELPTEVPEDLLAVLARETCKLASQMLAMCIRALDYCPPVDLRLGEFLRAVVTADRDLVSEDPWGYREAWIDAFKRRHIYPAGVGNLSEDALLWRPPGAEIQPVRGLTFADLKFNGDPTSPGSELELARQACALGQLVTKPELAGIFGLSDPDDPQLRGDRVDLPRVEMVRSFCRVGPRSRTSFGLIAEVSQRRIVRRPELLRDFHFHGGSTIIIDPRGVVRYVIAKRVTSNDRVERQYEFMMSRGRPFWEVEGDVRRPKRQLFKVLHEEPPLPIEFSEDIPPSNLRSAN